jgi:hypothetical protein
LFGVAASDGGTRGAMRAQLRAARARSSVEGCMVSTLALILIAVAYEKFKTGNRLGLRRGCLVTHSPPGVLNL